MIKHITKLLSPFNVSEKTLLELCPFYCQPNYHIYKLGLDHAIGGVKTTRIQEVAKGRHPSNHKNKKLILLNITSVCQKLTSLN